jgi:hypothetical protein
LVRTLLSHPWLIPIKLTQWAYYLLVEAVGRRNS